MAPLEGLIQQVQTNMANGSGTAINPSTGSNVSGGQVNGGVPAGMPASGPGLTAPTPGSAADANNVRNQLSNAAGAFVAGRAPLLNLPNIIRDTFTGAATNSTAPNDGTSGADAVLRIFLTILGLEDIVDLFSLRSSRGTEALGYITKRGKHITPDLGLPAERAWLWEMWEAENGLYSTGDLDYSSMLAATPEIQEAALHDLGPTFTIGLRQPISATQTANTKGIGNAKLKMPDLNAGSVEAAMRTISGTARSAGITVTD